MRKNRRVQSPKLVQRERKDGAVWQFQYRDEQLRARTKTLGPVKEMSRGLALVAMRSIVEPLNNLLFLESEEASNRRITFQEFVEQYYFEVKAGRGKDSTRVTTEQRTRKHLFPSLGARQLRMIRRVHLQNVLDMLAPHLSMHPLNALRFALNDIFRLAMADKVVESNPASALFLPPKFKPSKPKVVLPDLDALDPIKALLDVQELPIFLLTCCAGASIGEVLGLQLGDVALTENKILVRRRLYRGKIDTPKTKNRRREVALNEEIVAALQMWIEQLPVKKLDAWLFPSPRTNGPIERDGILKRIKAKLKVIGMDWVTFQVGRRSWATIAKANGVDAHTRAAQMGNTVDVNENEYAVAKFEFKAAAVSKFSKAVQ